MTTNTTNSADAATVTLCMGRKQFNSFLSSIFATSADDHSWKEADIDFWLEDAAAGMMRGFGRIEVFHQIPNHPIVALHDRESDTVSVTCPKPGPGIYRTVDILIEELRKARAA